MAINQTIKSIQETIQEFIQLETSGGIILFVMAILALIVSNSPLETAYNALLSLPFSIEFGPLHLGKPLIKWVNDGLMAIFFLLVGLEIKREIVAGELNSLAKLALPGFAAIGGMLVPALIYIYYNWSNATHIQGWAIPTATDIAFALGVLSLLGKRVPVSLKIFLTALAILDDLGAIIIIAIFYTHDLSYISLGMAGICLLGLLTLNLSGVKAITPYALVGILLWICVLKSGVHATLAGVALAMAIPLRDPANPERSPLKEWEHALHPWVAYLVLPVFAFFNAGVSFKGLTLAALFSAIPLGIAFGLFIGKQVGIFGASWIAVKLGLAKLPGNANWSWVYGIALICGIGFTMSLFIGTLAFNETGTNNYAVLVRLGVLVGSLLSGVLGYLFLYTMSLRHKNGVKLTAGAEG